MTQQNLTYEEIVSLINAFETSSEFKRFHLRYLDLELELEKEGALPYVGPRVWQGVSGEHSHHASEHVELAQKAAHATPPSTRAPDPVAASHEGLLKITSPMVGTFYVSPEPGAAPFVSVGHKVTAQTQVCIIEVMKLMSSVEAGVSGNITEIMVKNNEPVEFGQVLFWVQPD
jgi:acetyl-CoA carboxylase biotin carboxyl carrier protein